jgi:hypothetical protein
VPRRTFRPKREKVAEGWRGLHNEELHNLYASLNIITVIKSRRMKRVGHLVCMEEMRNAYKILVRKPKGKRPCGRTRHRWEDNIRLDLIEKVQEFLD